MPNTRFITRFLNALISNSDVQEAEPLLSDATFRQEVTDFITQVEQSEFVSNPLKITVSGSYEGPYYEGTTYGLKVKSRLYTLLESIVSRELEREELPGSWWKVHDITLNTLHVETTRARVFVLLVRHYCRSICGIGPEGTPWLTAGIGGVCQREFIVREYEVDAYNLSQGMKLIREFSWWRDMSSPPVYHEMLAYSHLEHDPLDYYGNWQLRYWTNKTSYNDPNGVEGLFILGPFETPTGEVKFFTLDRESSIDSGWVLTERENFSTSAVYCIDVWQETGNSKLAILHNVARKCKPPDASDISVQVWEIPDTYPDDPSVMLGEAEIDNFGQLRWINSDYLSVAGITNYTKYLVYDLLYAGDSTRSEYLKPVFRRVFDEEHLLPSSSIFASNIVYKTSESNEAITGMYYQIIPHFTGFIALSITTPTEALEMSPVVEVIDYYTGLTYKGLYHEFDTGAEYDPEEIEDIGLSNVIRNAIPVNINGLGQLFPQNQFSYALPAGTYPQGLRTATSLVSRVSNFLILDQGIPRIIAAQTNLIKGGSDMKVITKGGYQSVTFTSETINFRYPVTVKDIIFDYVGSLNNIRFSAQLTLASSGGSSSGITVPLMPAFSTGPTIKLNISNVTSIQIIGALYVSQQDSEIGISNLRVLYSV